MKIFNKELMKLFDDSPVAIATKNLINLHLLID